MITIISLLIIGLLFIIAEIIFISGTTVVGILGGIVSITGLYLAYQSYPDWIVFIAIGTIIIYIVAIFYAFKSTVWEKFSLKKTIESKAPSSIGLELKIGDIGTTISVLRPMGKAEFNNQTVEVCTEGGYLEANKKIQIIAINGISIIVEHVNE